MWDFNVKVSADIPVYICCNLVMSVYIFCLGKFRASSCYVIYCFLESSTYSTAGIWAIFYDFYLHVCCLESLILCCYNYNPRSLISVLHFSATYCVIFFIYISILEPLRILCMRFFFLPSFFELFLHELLCFFSLLSLHTLCWFCF